MGLDAIYFEQIKQRGGIFFVDAKGADKVNFKTYKFKDEDIKSRFLENCCFAVEKAVEASIKHSEDETPSQPSLDSILSVYSELNEQASLMCDNKKTGYFSDFVNTIMNNIGKVALWALLMDLYPSMQVSLRDYKDDFLFYVEANNHKVDVNTSRSWYGLLLLDGSSIEKLLVPEATVLIRIKPAVEEYLNESFLVCCKVLEELINKEISDKTNVVSYLTDSITKRENSYKEYGKILSDLAERRKSYDKDCGEYKKFSDEFFKNWRERNAVLQEARAISCIKNVIESFYIPDSSFLVSSLCKEILKDLLSYDIWTFDVPGFISRDDVKLLTTGTSYKISRGQTLNSIILNTDTFYARAKDLRPIEKIGSIF